MIRLSKRCHLRRHPQREGTATVEFALVGPVLILMVMGAIDVGQSINVDQIVNNASREGARQAARIEFTDEQQVESVVQDYIADAFNKPASGELNASVTVNVVDGAGSGLAGGDLTTIESGSPVSVQVIIQYDAVRWMVGLPGLTNTSIERTTHMRRE
jgi:Flp pilus assembly protein TadG